MKRNDAIALIILAYVALCSEACFCVFRVAVAAYRRVRASTSYSSSSSSPSSSTTKSPSSDSSGFSSSHQTSDSSSQSSGPNRPGLAAPTGPLPPPLRLRLLLWLPRSSRRLSRRMFPPVATTQQPEVLPRRRPHTILLRLPVAFPRRLSLRSVDEFGILLDLVVFA